MIEQSGMPQFAGSTGGGHPFGGHWLIAVAIKQLRITKAAKKNYFQKLALNFFLTHFSLSIDCESRTER